MLGYRFNSMISEVFSHLNDSGTLSQLLKLLPHTTVAWECSGSNWPCCTSCQPSMGLVVFQLPWMLLDPCHSWCCFLGPLPPPRFSSPAPAWSPALLRPHFPSLGSVSAEQTGTGAYGNFHPPPKFVPSFWRQRPPGVLKLQFNSIRVSVLCLPALGDGGCAPWDGFGGQGYIQI